jgi:hypothetical protein
MCKQGGFKVSKIKLILLTSFIFMSCENYEERYERCFRQLLEKESLVVDYQYKYIYHTYHSYRNVYISYWREANKEKREILSNVFKNFEGSLQKDSTLKYVESSFNLLNYMKIRKCT